MQDREAGGWWRWSVSALGLFGVAVSLAFVAIDRNVASVDVFGVGVPLVVSLAVVGVGGWLAREYEPAEIRRIAGWAAAGLCALGLLGTWNFLVHVSRGMAPAAAVQLVLSAAAVGAGGGILVGRYDVHQRRERTRGEHARKALNASMDGIAVLDEAGEYVTVNEAHAEVYGYDDPEAFVGESWRTCYGESELERFDEAVMPELAEAGSWRGSAVGQRADGTRFHQELSLTAMDDGGLVCVVRDVDDRVERDEQLAALHEASRELTTATDTATVADTTVDIAERILDKPLSTLWRYEEEADHLVPVAATESSFDLFDVSSLDELAPIETDSLGMDVYRSGEARLIPDYGEIDNPAFPDLGLGSVVIVPVGEYGILEVGQREVESVSETERRHAEILALKARAALERTDRERELEAMEARFRALTENSPLGVVSVDESSTVRFASPAIEDILGYEPADLEGEPLTTIVPDRLEESHREGIRRYLATGDRNLDWSGIELPGVHADGHEVDLGVSFGELERDDRHVFTGVIRDISARKRQERQIRALQDATLALRDARSEAAVAERAVDIAQEVLDQPFAVVWRHDESENVLRPVTGTDDLIEFVRRQGADGLPTWGEGSAEMRAFQAGDTRVHDYQETEGASDLPLGTVAFASLSDHGLLALGSPEHRDVSETDRYLVDILARNVTAALDRVKREQGLADLHEVARETVRMTEAEAICERALAAITGILDKSISGVWLLDESGTELRPVASSPASEALFDEMPTFEAGGDSLSWQVFEAGEVRTFDDVREHSDRHNQSTPIRSEIVVPLGAYGIVNIGSTEPGAFDESDALLARLLAANTAVALERAQGERELRTRTDQMDFFNSILRHDVLNGMTVIRARAEMLADDLDGEHEQFADTIVDWSDDVTDIVERVRTVLETLTGTTDREFEPVGLSAVVREECARVRQTYPEVTVESDVPDGVSVLADELLAEIVGNLVTNAVEHNDPEDLQVRASVEAGEEWATLRVADDGRGVPEDDRETIFRRGETGHAKSTGSGFGLFFVDAMVTAYGGSVDVEDNDAGGATFVVELPTPRTASAELPAAGQEP